jgi:fermentation-respiration switch protein FrsA (DUF1100 family)
VGFLRGCVSNQFFYPDRHVHGFPAPQGRFEEVFFASADGTGLHGWFVHAQGQAKGTVVHLHGNARNITAHHGFVAWLPAAGYNVLEVDYRGYGRSEGSPSIEGVMDDGLAAIQYVRGREDVDKNRLLVLGQSLGAAVAATVVGREQPPGVRGVVLDSGFASFSGIVADKMRAMVVLAPLTFLAPGLIDDGDSPDRYVAQIAPRPVLLLHGKADRVIGPEHSERLFELAGEPKELHVAEGADHLEALNNSGGAYRRILLRFFERCLKNGSAGG